MFAIKSFLKKWQPLHFQGWNEINSYFEGWYFKLVSRDESIAIAFIPGISYDDQGVGHSFVQFYNGSAPYAEYYKFDVKSFRPKPDSFRVDVDKCSFDIQRIVIDLPRVHGTIDLVDVQPYQGRWYSPGIMGWYSFVPFMQCYHGLGSMNHTLKGSLSIDGQKIDFNKGKGYLEKDWGSSFPKAYTWMQSNHFASQKGASIMASVAHIPWMGRYFIGFLAVFWLKGQWYIFTTYTGAKMKLIEEDDYLLLEYWDHNNRMIIKAHPAPGIPLVSPIKGSMTGKINESIQSILEVMIYTNGELIFEDEGTSAGFEAVGDLSILRDS